MIPSFVDGKSHHFSRDFSAKERKQGEIDGHVSLITESNTRPTDKQVSPKMNDGPRRPASPPLEEIAVDEISITIAFALLGATWLTLRGMDGRERRRTRR